MKDSSFANFAQAICMRYRCGANNMKWSVSQSERINLEGVVADPAQDWHNWGVPFADSLNGPTSP